MMPSSPPLHPDAEQRTICFFTQTFVPDPAAVGQYMTRAAEALAARGHRVVVYTSANGYDDPSVVYPRREEWRSVEIRRIGFSSFGKTSLLARALGAASFATRCLIAGCTMRRIDGVVVSTSPPFIGLIAAVLNRIRGVPFAYWAMDLNPDQLIALGKLRSDAPLAKVLTAVNTETLGRAAYIIALDRFMARRLEPKRSPTARLDVIPPWPQQAHIRPVARRENHFRTRHGWDDKTVVMYSGNHTPSNPLQTVLDAALALRDEPAIHFAFIGGGASKADVTRWVAMHELRNVTCLPYQPLEEIGHSLSAGDVHVVTMGDALVGVIHPSKVYAAMAASRPVLYLGPAESHVEDLFREHAFGWSVRHHDVEGMVRILRTIQYAGLDLLDAKGIAGYELLSGDLSEQIQLAKLCDGIESTLSLR